MKKLLFSLFIIFSSVNVFAHYDELSRINEIEQLAKKFHNHFRFFITSKKRCDAEFIKYWFYSKRMTVGLGIRIYPYLCEELKRDPDVILEFVKIKDRERDYYGRRIIISILKKFNHKLVPNYDEFARIVVNNNGHHFKYIEPEELSSSKVYDELARTAMRKAEWAFEYVKPEELSSSKVYDELARTAVSDYGMRLRYVKPLGLSSSKVYVELIKTAVSEDPRALQYENLKYVNNYHELLKIVMDDENIEYFLLNKLFPFKGVFYLEETKQRDFLNAIKSFRCKTRRVLHRNCGQTNKNVNQWLEDYYSYEKKQEAN